MALSDLLVFPEAVAQKKMESFLLIRYFLQAESILWTDHCMEEWYFWKQQVATDRKKAGIGINLRCQVIDYLATSPVDYLESTWSPCGLGDKSEQVNI